MGHPVQRGQGGATVLPGLSTEVMLQEQGAHPVHPGLQFPTVTSRAPGPSPRGRRGKDLPFPVPSAPGAPLGKGKSKRSRGDLDTHSSMGIWCGTE